MRESESESERERVRARVRESERVRERERGSGKVAPLSGKVVSPVFFTDYESADWKLSDDVSCIENSSRR